MAKKKGPALYELIRPAGSETLPTPTQAHQNKRIEDDDNLTHNVLTPGRSIRMSIGTIGVFAAVAIALIVISYTIGFNRGEAIAREDYGTRLFEEVAGTRPVQKPVAPVISPQIDPQPELQEPTVRPKWGGINADPRVAGTHYFILSQTTKEGAERIAAFCRENGLETYAISGDNTRLHRVIALPGFESRDAQGVNDLRMNIRTIGQAWAEGEGRGDDLHDAYLSLYQGG
ncbi:MAG: hypothetical protein QGI78_08530 [Phycisphaerales bacterium]|nr:hypothetical protein [Phycisphaerales bacterium]